MTLVVFMIFLFSCTENKEVEINNEINCLDSIEGIDYSYLSATQTVNFKLPSFSYYFENISQFSGLSNSINSRLTNLESFQDINHLLFTLIGIRTGGYGPPVISDQTEILNEDELNSILKSKMLNFDEKSMIEWNKLSFNFKKQIIELYLAIEDADVLLKDFSDPLKEYLYSEEAETLDDLHNLLIKPWKTKELSDFTLVDRLSEIDLVKLSYASRIILEKIDRLLKYKASNFIDDFTHCSVNSNLGDFLISGTSNDSINDDFLFTIELGGDDVYKGNIATSDPLNKLVSIIIDFKGDDEYITDGYLCSSLVGFSCLVDLQGSDKYFAGKPGIASASFGTSFLYDYSGNDIYTSTSKHSMGAAIFGASALIDMDGDDCYNSVSYSQGFGGTFGVGCLYDKNGDDHYNTDTLLYKKRQLPSFVQGASKGRWAEATDGQSLGGGVGILIDESGYDEFYANSFSQGASYFFGIGLFYNQLGDDKYNAISHSQGYAAHYTLASFIDEEGDDTYNKKSNKDELTQIIGCGRDLSVGLFQDKGGDDEYFFGNRSAGIGDMNGIGVMIDYKGADEYNWINNGKYSNSPSMGKTFKTFEGLNKSRVHPAKDLCKGIFLDMHGDFKIKKQKNENE